MHRRIFIKKLASAVGGLGLLSAVPGSILAQSVTTGKLVMALQLDGGLDVTSFCDPKMNIAGEPEINQWARTADTQQVGNISYAPYAGNSAFFRKYYSDILIINGVDAQTNSHSVGIVHNWSGRNAEGFPTITALYAATVAPELPMSYLNFGGFGNTSGIIRSTRVDSVNQIRNIIFPNQDEYGNGIHRVQSDWDRIQALQIENLASMSQEINMPEGNLQNRQFYLDALSRAEGIKEFGNIIPEDGAIQQGRSIGRNFYSTLHQQIQISLLAFKSGVSISADLHESGYDSHVDHDLDHTVLLANATDALDYLWTYAEELGLADRLVVIVGSDFGRTPYYNEGAGKDHWPIGSYMFMERNAGYTNQVIGETDGGHNALKINTSSLLRDDSGGTLIHPSHVHKALRRYLGIENSPVVELFPFTSTEDFEFFS